MSKKRRQHSAAFTFRLTLPIYPELTESLIAKVIDTVVAFFEQP